MDYLENITGPIQSLLIVIRGFILAPTGFSKSFTSLASMCNNDWAFYATFLLSFPPLFLLNMWLITS